MTFTPLDSTASGSTHCARRATREQRELAPPAEVKLSLEHRSWLNRRVCVMDLSDVSRRMGTRVDGFIGQDVLTEFSSVKIDYKNHTLELEQ